MSRSEDIQTALLSSHVVFIMKLPFNIAVPAIRLIKQLLSSTDVPTSRPAGPYGSEGELVAPCMRASKSSRVNDATRRYRAEAAIGARTLRITA